MIWRSRRSSPPWQRSVGAVGGRIVDEQMEKGRAEDVEEADL